MERLEEELRKWSEDIEPRFSLKRRVALAKALLTGGLKGFARKLGEFVNEDVGETGRRFRTCNDIASYIFLHSLETATRMPIKDILDVLRVTSVLIAAEQMSRAAEACKECEDSDKGRVM